MENMLETIRAPFEAIAQGQRELMKTVTLLAEGFRMPFEAMSQIRLIKSPTLLLEDMCAPFEAMDSHIRSITCVMERAWLPFEAMDSHIRSITCVMERAWLPFETMALQVDSARRMIEKQMHASSQMVAHLALQADSFGRMSAVGLMSTSVFSLEYRQEVMANAKEELKKLEKEQNFICVAQDIKNELPVLLWSEAVRSCRKPGREKL